MTVRSEGANDPGRTASTSGRAYIEVNGKNYAPQSKGFNVVAFDALSGKKLCLTEGTPAFCGLRFCVQKHRSIIDLIRAYSLFLQYRSSV